MDSTRDAYDELYAYTMTRPGPAFVLQHVVDAFGAQTATPDTKPIALTFALVGLYLHVDKQFSGREVQNVHMHLGRQKHTWPSFILPQDRGAMTARDVLAAAPGPERDRAIDDWCRAVWMAYRGSEATIAQLLQEHRVELWPQRWR